MSDSTTITTDTPITGMSVTTDRQWYSSPGQILKEEYLEPLGISNYRLAKAINVSETAVGEVIRGKRRISTAMAVRLARALDTTPQYWLNLQNDYDLLTFDTASVGDIRPLVSA